MGFYKVQECWVCQRSSIGTGGQGNRTSLCITREQNSGESLKACQQVHAVWIFFQIRTSFCHQILHPHDVIENQGPLQRRSVFSVTRDGDPSSQQAVPQNAIINARYGPRYHQQGGDFRRGLGISNELRILQSKDFLPKLWYTATTPPYV